MGNILRSAVIFDRDGTLFSVDGPTDSHDNEAWANFNARIRFDAPVPLVHGLWHAIRPGIDRIIVSGRDGAYAHAMRDSFAKHGLWPDAFFCRDAGDRRLDSVVKTDILERHILPYWEVRFVVDDRPQVVKMWRAHGLPVLQVTDPKIDPPVTQWRDPFSHANAHAFGWLVDKLEEVGIISWAEIKEARARRTPMIK